MTKTQFLRKLERKRKLDRADRLFARMAGFRQTLKLPCKVITE